ncbi:unnamed protein product [Acanthoscelides obtectus]|nr:unnamed protein product [Acanthoscelides obtectus]CAK1654566.1 hypothetical protein AOBTE_LOCUS18679 [Acanthoscelides obtectus]
MTLRTLSASQGTSTVLLIMTKLHCVTIKLSPTLHMFQPTYANPLSTRRFLSDGYRMRSETSLKQRHVCNMSKPET